MLKKISIQLFIFLLLQTTPATDEKIISIGNLVINEADIIPSTSYTTKLAEKLSTADVSDSTKKKISEKVQYILKKNKLAFLANDIVHKNLKKKYYPELISSKDIDKAKQEMLVANKNKLERYRLLLQAIKYVEDSKKQDRISLAYDKFLKPNSICTYDFLERNYKNKKFKKFLEDQIKHINQGQTELHAAEISEITSKKLEVLLIQNYASDKKHITEHIELSELHQCNFKMNIIKSSIIREVESMGYKLHTEKYGSLRDVLWPPVEEYSKFISVHLNLQKNE
ncbi:MAG: hypothetical protein PHS31_05700 [Victivallaceae bacterium]|nr:hypothetical protein [Victivallaceae bacterium]MDD4181767.1 hypothetical protein [Victivallaceae bacterium]